DQTAAKGLSVARSQVQEGSRQMDRLLNKFSQASFRAHQAVAAPANRISAALHACQAGLARLLGGKNHDPNNPIPDRDILT
ncbi:MAG: hypothetical protein ACE5JX_14525, partial [Acidobacteriota bacterium]